MWEATPETIDLLNVQNSSDPQISSMSRFTGVATAQIEFWGSLPVQHPRRLSWALSLILKALESMGEGLCAPEMRIFVFARQYVRS